VDTVDNSKATGDGQADRPPTASREPFTSASGAETVLRGGDGSARPPVDPADRDTPSGEPPASALGPSEPPGRAGADLAREALRAAQRAAAARGRRRGVPSLGAWRRAGRGARRGGWSGARPDDRDPQPLGRLAARLAEERGWRDRLTTESVFSRWAELVGSDVAEHATPVSLRDGELTVTASSTAWATQLRTLQRQLLAKIAAGVGPDVVRKMKIRGPAAPSWRRGPRHAPGRGPRDTYG
jgi:predicted nucleic acid-binding Zn ribbon protein